MSRADQYQVTQQHDILEENKSPYATITPKSTRNEDSSTGRDPGYIFSCCLQCLGGICIALTCGLCCEECGLCDC
jgi:hypothetical protein